MIRNIFSFFCINFYCKITIICWVTQSQSHFSKIHKKFLELFCFTRHNSTSIEFQKIKFVELWVKNISPCFISFKFFDIFLFSQVTDRFLKKSNFRHKTLHIQRIDLKFWKMIIFLRFLQCPKKSFKNVGSSKKSSSSPK